jgi:hypothetical protein
MENWEDEFEKNIYVIKRKLTTYRMLPGEGQWTFNIGSFTLNVKLVSDDYWKVTNHGNDRPKLSEARIIDFEKFDVDLYEKKRKDDDVAAYVYLTRDPRFKDHLPIQYDVIETPTGGRLNMSEGKNMPQLQLMELMRLLHRLSNLTAFL